MQSFTTTFTMFANDCNDCKHKKYTQINTNNRNNLINVKALKKLVKIFGDKKKVLQLCIVKNKLSKEITAVAFRARMSNAFLIWR